MFKSLTFGSQMKAESVETETKPNLPPQPQPSSSPQSDQDFQPSSIAEDVPQHFDDLIDAAPSGGGGDNGGSIPSTMLDKDAFHKMFVGIFGVASVLTHLQSLKVSGEDANARAASDALYETIVDIPALHFLLEPQGKWAGRVMCIGMFAVPMALNVQAELAARGRTSRAAPEQDSGVIVPDFDMTGKSERP